MPVSSFEFRVLKAVVEGRRGKVESRKQKSVGLVWPERQFMTESSTWMAGFARKIGDSARARGKRIMLGFDQGTPRFLTGRANSLS